MMRRETPLKSIRKYCLECCCESAKEVRLCTAVGCPLYQFRLGHNPNRKWTDQQKQERVKNMKISQHTEQIFDRNNKEML